MFHHLYSSIITRFVAASAVLQMISGLDEQRLEVIHIISGPQISLTKCKKCFGRPNTVMK